MSDGEDFELDSDETFGFTVTENDAAWMTLHIVIQVAILIAAHVHKSALFVLFALFSQVRRCFQFISILAQFYLVQPTQQARTL